MPDRNCLSYWFPKLQTAGVPVPRTELIDAGGDWPKMIGFSDDPKRHPAEHREAEAVIGPLADAIRSAARKVDGYPLFLRTGHFSGKHDWSKTCFVPHADSVAEHVRMIVYMSEMFGMFGELPYRVWAVRELLPVDAVAVLPAYGDMPLAKEVRSFVAGGRIRCSHPYWPALSIADGLGMPREDGRVKGAADCALLADLERRATAGPEDRAEWQPLAERVAAAFADDGSWSVDLLATRRGWFVTDCAEAGRSFHWPGCPHAPEGRP